MKYNLFVLFHLFKMSHAMLLALKYSNGTYFNNISHFGLGFDFDFDSKEYFNSLYPLIVKFIDFCLVISFEFVAVLQKIFDYLYIWTFMNQSVLFYSCIFIIMTTFVLSLFLDMNHTIKMKYKKLDIIIDDFDLYLIKLEKKQRDIDKKTIAFEKFVKNKLNKLEKKMTMYE